MCIMADSESIERYCSSNCDSLIDRRFRPLPDEIWKTREIALVARGISLRMRFGWLVGSPLTQDPGRLVLLPDRQPLRYTPHRRRIRRSTLVASARRPLSLHTHPASPTTCRTTHPCELTRVDSQSRSISAFADRIKNPTLKERMIYA